MCSDPFANCAVFHVQDQCVRLLTQELQHGVAGLATLSIAPSAGGAGAGGAGPSTPARDAPPQSSVAVRSPGSTPSLSPLGVSGVGSPAPVVEAGATLSWEWVEQQLVDVGANAPPACGTAVVCQCLCSCLRMCGAHCLLRTSVCIV